MPLKFSSKFVRYVVLLPLMLAAPSASTQDSAQQAANPTHLAATKQLTKAEFFNLAYIYSFDFDRCNDPSFGRWYRTALISKMESCPYTDAAKKEFYMQAVSEADDALAGLITYFNTHSSMPKDENGKSCSAILGDPKAIALRKKLEQFYDGKINLTDIEEFKRPCLDSSDFIPRQTQPGANLPPVTNKER